MRAPHATANCLSEIPQIYLFCSTLRAMSPARYARRTLGLRARVGCAAICHACTPALRARSPASRLCGMAARTPTPITYSDCLNECLYQFGSQKVKKFGRQRWICSLAVSPCTVKTRTRGGMGRPTGTRGGLNAHPRRNPIENHNNGEISV
jgi:hypothetical protein